MIKELTNSILEKVLEQIKTPENIKNSKQIISSANRHNI